MHKRWFRLDTAALIFPATMRRRWCNVFRLSAVLADEIEPALLQQAVSDLMPRFPALYVRLCTGFFWCYLEQCEAPPTIRQDFAYPLAHMGKRELHTCCLRVFYYQDRIAVEFFHSLTDGHGGSVYLSTLLARYAELRYGAKIAPGGSILDWKAAPEDRELEDSFFKNSVDVPASRREATAYRLHGTPEPEGYKHLITGIVDAERLLELAHEYQCTVTVFLAAVMIRAIIGMQNEDRPKRFQRPVKITIPVDLRRLYGSVTMRNFALALNLGVDPKLGEYTLKELCASITHQLAVEATPQNMAARIAANVIPQKVLPLRIAPLFIKNIAMELVYSNSGEKKGCLNISNLGVMRLPEELRVRRLDFIIGVQRSYPNNCSVVSYQGRTYINMIRNIRESELERRFFSALVELGIPVDIESNGKEG